MPNLVLPTLALLASPLVSFADTPKAVVMHFLSLTQREDWGAAAAMLTKDAQLGVGDVGGPLNAETLPSLASVYKAGCRNRDVILTADRPPAHPDTRFVETHWDCPNREGPGTHEVKITFFVQGAKLAGYHIS